MNPKNGDSKPQIIYVDADATPRDALETTDRLGALFGIPVITVSSINHQFDRPGHISVDSHPQAVDMEILGRLKRDHPAIVITQDYGLASLVLAKGHRAISPTGLVFTEMNMDRLLFERDLHARERRATGRSRGPRARQAEDRERFERGLRLLLMQVASE